MDRSTHGDRLIENIPLCESCYRSYVAGVNEKIEDHYHRAELEAAKVFKLNQVLKQCKPMFAQVAA